MFRPVSGTVVWDLDLDVVAQGRQFKSKNQCKTEMFLPSFSWHLVPPQKAENRVGFENRTADLTPEQSFDLPRTMGDCALFG